MVALAAVVLNMSVGSAVALTLLIEFVLVAAGAPLLQLWEARLRADRTSILVTDRGVGAPPTKLWRTSPSAV